MLRLLGLNLLLFCACLLSALPSVEGQTRIKDQQLVSGNWTLKGSPYIIEGEAIVPEGKELIVQPGVQVLFKTGENSVYPDPGFDMGMLRVNGKLRAVGAPDRFIEFTRDGNEGYWGTILIENDANLLLEYCKFSYGFQVDDVRQKEFTSAFGTLSLHDCVASIRHCLFHNIELWCIFLDNTQLQLDYVTIIDAYTPIYIHDGEVLSVTNSLIYDYASEDIIDGSFSSEEIVRHSLIQTATNAPGETNLVGVQPLWDTEYQLVDGSPGKEMSENGTEIGAFGGETPFFTAPFLDRRLPLREGWQFTYKSEIKTYLERKTMEYKQVSIGMNAVEEKSLQKKYQQDFRQELQGYEDQFKQTLQETEYLSRAKIAASLVEIEDKILEYGPYNSLRQTLPIRGKVLNGALQMNPEKGRAIYPELADNSLYAYVQLNEYGSALDTFNIHLELPGQSEESMILSRGDRPVFYEGFDMDEARLIGQETRFEMELPTGLNEIALGGSLEIPFTLRNNGPVPIRHLEWEATEGIPGQVQIFMAQALPEVIQPGEEVSNKFILWARGKAPVGGYSVTIELKDIYCLQPERIFLGISVVE